MRVLTLTNRRTQPSSPSFHSEILHGWCLSDFVEYTVQDPNAAFACVNAEVNYYGVACTSSIFPGIQLKFPAPPARSAQATVALTAVSANCKPEERAASKVSRAKAEKPPQCSKKMHKLSFSMFRPTVGLGSILPDSAFCNLSNYVTYCMLYISHNIYKMQW